MIPSDASISRTLPLRIGKKLRSPCTSVVVGVRPADELTGRHLVVIGEVEGVKVLVHLVAQVVLHVERDAAAPVAPEVRGDERQDAEADEQRQPRGQRRAVVQDDVVDDLALDQRHQGLGGAPHERTAERDLEVAPVPHEVGPQPAHPAGTVSAAGGRAWCRRAGTAAAARRGRAGGGRGGLRDPAHFPPAAARRSARWRSIAPSSISRARSVMAGSSVARTTSSSRAAMAASVWLRSSRPSSVSWRRIAR